MPEQLTIGQRDIESLVQTLREASGPLTTDELLQRFVTILREHLMMEAAQGEKNEKT